MTILVVVGGTGTVGRAVTRNLTGSERAVRIMTRSPDKAATLPKGVEGVVGDLDRPETLEAAFAGASAVFLVTPLGATESACGLAAVAAAQRAGIGRIVYMTIHKLEAGAHIPHFGAKIPVVEAVEKSGIPYTIIAPNNFFQNDLWLKEAILQFGVYPQPLGEVGLSRVDVGDIADAAATALTEPGHEGKTYPLVGPEAWTGPESAEAWSQALGRTIHYGGNDLDAWSEQVSTMMPPWLVHDLRVMYQWQQEEGQIATPDDLAACTAILGRPPRGYENFVAEMAAVWKA